MCKRMLSVLFGGMWTIGEDNLARIHVKIDFTLLSVWMRWFYYCKRFEDFHQNVI